jgi:hypothetical protein
MFEGSHIPMHLWLRALYLIQLGRRPISPFKLHHILGLSSKTVASMVRRIQVAAKQVAANSNEPNAHIHARIANPGSRGVGTLGRDAF